jgi:hypothetical protein
MTDRPPTPTPRTPSASATDIEVQDIGQRHGFSGPAAMAMFDALVAGGGGMAQFNHPEFGGSGQWMRGGMLMVSDLFNHALKARVQNLCAELASWLADHPAAALARTTGAPRHPTGGTGTLPSSGSARPSSPTQGDTRPAPWWRGDWGAPSSTGAQNGMRYAWFPEQRRLAVEVDGQVTVHDTGTHAIQGFSQQQQTADASLAFTSQHGPVKLSELPIVGDGPQDRGPLKARLADPQERPPSADVLSTLERLAGLKAQGILTDDEFAAKKTELLSRL